MNVFTVIEILLLSATVVLLLLSLIKRSWEIGLLGLVPSAVFWILAAVEQKSSPKPPEEIYQMRLQAVEDAQKELEKFYIDYPQFKGN